MNYSSQFKKVDFSKLKTGPPPHQISGVKLPPDGDAQIERDVGDRSHLMAGEPIGLSYPDGQDFGPYVQAITGGLFPSFTLDFENTIPFSAGNVAPATAMMLFSLILNQRPVCICETGTFYGYSTWFMAEALRLLGDGGIIHTMDVTEELVDESVLNHPNVEFHKGSSVKILPELLPKLGEVQAVFLDSYKRLSLWEFYQVHEYIPPGGLCIYHDTQFLNTGKSLVTVLAPKIPGIYHAMLFCGTPKTGDPHHYFGNADDRGLLVLRKIEENPYLNVADSGSDKCGAKLISDPTGLYKEDD